MVTEDTLTYAGKKIIDYVFMGRELPFAVSIFLAGISEALLRIFKRYIVENIVQFDIDSVSWWHFFCFYGLISLAFPKKEKSRNIPNEIQTIFASAESLRLSGAPMEEVQTKYRQAYRITYDIISKRSDVKKM